MHPLEKIVIFLSLCQVVQTFYLVAHVHVLHGVSRLWYLAKMLPLVALTIALVVFVLRVFQLIPYVGI
jgi:hypothetical protein